MDSTPPILTSSITYQWRSDELAGILAKRVLLRPRIVAGTLFWVVPAAIFYFALPSARYVSVILFLIGFSLPLRGWLAVRRAVKSNAVFSELKTVTFGPDGLRLSSPSVNSEMKWSVYTGFSEDKRNFYLHLGKSGFDSVLPKSAFNASQQEEFRKLASSKIA